MHENYEESVVPSSIVCVCVVYIYIYIYTYIHIYIHILRTYTYIFRAFDKTRVRDDPAWSPV